MTRRNFAAIRDALEAIVDEIGEDDGETPSSGGGDLIFFQIQADAVGSDSVAVKEMVWNAGLTIWEPTGPDYTAYDWTPSGRHKVNFQNGYYGVGRITTEVAADALGVIATEGKARLIQGTLDENMGATTSQQAQTTVTHYWGDAPNGRDPGTPVIIHDVSGMAPAAVMNDVVMAIWDEKRQIYVMIAPWKGTQTPGTTAIAKCDSGSSVDCDTSSSEDSFCVHSGRLQTLSVLGDFCMEKFTDGAPVWLLDARSCHSDTRLNNNERYIAVSAGVTFDPGSDERPLFVVVDYAPSFRWFRVMADADTLAAVDESNDLRCRDFDCGGDQPDDAPSVYGIWEDIDPCSRELQVIEATPTLLYFPMHRDLCAAPEDLDDVSACKGSVDNRPDCRKNKHILAWWNPIAQRWDALHDAAQCSNEEDVSLIYVCEGEIIPDCCLFDALKIDFLPRSGSYCDPKKEFTKVWMKCNTQQESLTKGFCELGVRICDALTCNGETRPVYLVRCAACPGCECPDEDKGAHVTIRVADPDGDCGYMDDVMTDLYCFDQNPFLSSPPADNGFAGILEFTALMPRALFAVPVLPGNDPPYTDDIVWLEIAGYGDTGFNPGDIMSAWADPGGGADFVQVPIPAPALYDGSIFDCHPLILAGELKYRTVERAYGVWFECDILGGEGRLKNAQLYWLKTNYSTTSISPLCSGGVISRTIVGDPDTDVLSGAEDLDVEDAPCCANRTLACPVDLTMSCNGANPDTLITVEGVGDVISVCQLEGSSHYFGGCPCAFLETGTGSNCARNSAALCGDPDNEICFEFYWPF